MEFPEILYKLRKDRFMNSIELARDLDVSPSTISLWESGKRTPDYRTIIKICNHFGVTADFLLGLDTNTTDTLVLNLISNDKIIMSHADYYKRHKKIDFDSTEYRKKRQAINDEIKDLNNQKNSTLEFKKQKRAMQNEELLDCLNRDVNKINIEISKLEKKKQEIHEHTLNKAMAIDELNKENSYGNKIMYSLNQITKNYHFQKSLVYQILFLCDLGIKINTDNVVFSNYQNEISELYFHIRNNLNQTFDFMNNAKAKDILKYIENESEKYIKFIEND